MTSSPLTALVDGIHLTHLTWSKVDPKYIVLPQFFHTSIGCKIEDPYCIGIHSQSQKNGQCKELGDSYDKFTYNQRSRWFHLHINGCEGFGFYVGHCWWNPCVPQQWARIQKEKEKKHKSSYDANQYSSPTFSSTLINGPPGFTKVASA